jgi:hypothetical protein
VAHGQFGRHRHLIDTTVAPRNPPSFMRLDGQSRSSASGNGRGCCRDDYFGSNLSAISVPEGLDPDLRILSSSMAPVAPVMNLLGEPTHPYESFVTNGRWNGRSSSKVKFTGLVTPRGPSRNERFVVVEIDTPATCSCVLH